MSLVNNTDIEEILWWGRQPAMFSDLIIIILRSLWQYECYRWECSTSYEPWNWPCSDMLYGIPEWGWVFIWAYFCFSFILKYLYVNLLGWGYDGYVPAWVEVDLFFTATVSKVNNVKLRDIVCWKKISLYNWVVDMFQQVVIISRTTRNDHHPTKLKIDLQVVAIFMNQTRRHDESLWQRKNWI